MKTHNTAHVPVDDTYVALVGKAVYVFSYYEWTLIHMIECLRSGFVGEYSRGGPFTSGDVKKKFQGTIDSLPSSFQKVPVCDLQNICNDFDKLIVKRNALIHAHPITDMGGAQILAYQAKTTRPLPDIKWSKTEVESIIAAFDEAAYNAVSMLECLG